ncbi:transcriptional regulator, HxlR family [Streptoalloteichus tenebrarius]|uniref:Transcriptional regulator, HxlR family n=2 Tax=Streptoalloteichus tenebrarius (strain ATCC 17920 / DSM 40477 / JCM 4838 / CBS 697.72 / NBRC 16177 / NCIMB 11028 / NRRL B-12390 / A12253. 1 / ISP 5477) TaxID=1933 RepID=A0ABT1HTP2_STRSD|nr:transcriptional regulator, HxlR family [Streptoalloteichus tenebrarius]
MFQNCQDVVAPVRIGDKWTGKILVCLGDGARRFSELRVPLHMVTPKVLTESLRAMERDGLVRRTAHPGVPPRVEYSLTELGHRMREFFMDTVCAWNASTLPEVLEARAAYDRRVSA